MKTRKIILLALSLSMTAYYVIHRIQRRRIQWNKMGCVVLYFWTHLCLFNLVNVHGNHFIFNDFCLQALICRAIRSIQRNMQLNWSDKNEFIFLNLLKLLNLQNCQWTELTGIFVWSLSNLHYVRLYIYTEMM